MKKTALHAALLALSLPMSLHALGLGEMKIESSLDQPFKAEIELIDIGSASINSIRVGLADPENFERVGLERIAVLSLLSFKVEKNAKGVFVIKIDSLERMTEPYMELVVDLAWPNGQLFKAYTVLLDPPGYQIDATTQPAYPSAHKATGYRHETGVVDKQIISDVEHNPVQMQDGRNQTTYGPTVTNENVWQIAQRYKTSEVILPQVVLAIVGANIDAFTNGNLNGLKVGVRLVIPSTKDMKMVPEDLATQEVMAHDTAWNEKNPINHVISPPYMGYQAPKLNEPTLSEIPSIPKFSQSATQASSLSQLINVNSFVPGFKQDEPKAAPVHQTNTRESTTTAEIAITTAAVESVRESNALLMEQLHLIQDQNKKLQQQLDKREKEMELIRNQLLVLTKERQAVAPQAAASTTKSNSSSIWPLFLLLLAAGGGSGYAYWYFKRRELKDEEEQDINPAPVEPKPFIPPVHQETISIKEPIPTAFMPNPVDDTKPVKPEVKVVETPEIQKPIVTPVLEEKETASDLIDYANAKNETSTEAPKITEAKSTELLEPDTKPSELNSHVEPKIVKAQPLIPDMPITPVAEPSVEGEPGDLLEFESGLHHLVQDTPHPKNETPIKSDDEDNDKLDFTSEVVDKPLVEEDKPKHVVEEDLLQVPPEEELDAIEFDIPLEVEKPKVQEPLKDDVSEFKNIISSSTTANPLKSTKALDTLLSLAKTYIGMDDVESARHSLEEIIEHGNEEQKKEATQILEDLNKRK